MDPIIDDARMALIREAIAGGGEDATPEAYEALQTRVLEAKFSSEETLAAADALAADGTAMDRAIFREWMRVQAAAEQGQRFGVAPAASIAVEG